MTGEKRLPPARHYDLTLAQQERDIERVQKTLATVEDMKAWAQWLGAFIVFSLAILGLQSLWSAL